MTHEEFYATIGGKGLKCGEESMLPNEGRWVTGERCARCGYDPAIHEAFEFKPQPELTMTVDELEAYIDLAFMYGEKGATHEDSRDVPVRIMKWAGEFNAAHRGKEWGVDDDDDEDYIQAIGDFFNAKYEKEG